jgi:hypothetical protein
MQGSLTLGIALGVGLAGANIALSIIFARKAMRAPSARFVGAVFKSMGVRMAGMLATVILVFLFIPVDPVAFAVSFLSVAIIGLVIEVRMLLRATGQSSEDGSGIS